MAVFGLGTILGPIMGPALGGWLTYDYSWRWVFYINLPVGVFCTLGILVFIRQTRNVHYEPFDFVGFLTLSLGIGALQLMLDRGELKDWFRSSEIWIDGRRARFLSFYRAHGNHNRRREAIGGPGCCWPVAALARPAAVRRPPDRAGRADRSRGDGRKLARPV
jgi:hypothetical protein